MADYYANLELPYGAGAEAVRAARRRLVKRYHPDRFVTDEAKAQTAHLLVQNLNVAHDELLHYLARRTHE
jgi:curved DNA-binding protein CbpA